MAVQDSQKCAVCSKPSSKQCARCKSLRYCSTTCQSKHWKSEHKRKCQQPASSAQTPPHKTRKLLHEVLFPYHDFLILFNSHKQLFPPCGLVNCGNTCFANVILQCLAHTRPLVAYLLDKGHRKDCRRNQWCFLCDLQQHMETAIRCRQPFSPITILSRLPTIGGNLGNGRQEDAHEFIRFAIDKMQSVCLDEHGGEKLIHPRSQQTTLIQHIFGGQLQSQVVCTQCNQVSRQYENMLDLTVEIQGDATLLEECLNQFTMKEWLHGDNLYNCDRCNDYVRAWKRLTIQQAPNILTIALKRFQSGRFGKINKRITFPENLDLSPYMSEGADGTDIYKLYAVVVHVDMLNASFFGHYICYTKGFQGEWYRIDDCKVTRVELDEVLSQGAYMLMYSRVSARPTCLKSLECGAKQKVEEKADFGACHGNVEDLGVINPVANGDTDVQCSYQVCDSSGLYASCGTSNNVKQGHRCEKEGCVGVVVGVGGNENDEHVGVGGDEESSRCCGREDEDVCGRGQENGKDGVEMELEDGKMKEHGSV